MVQYLDCCPVCGGDRFRRVYRRHGFQLVRCTTCTLLLVNPQAPISETRELYNEQYFGRRDLPAAGASGDAIRGFRMLSAERRLSEIDRSISPPGRLLDVGCGEGFFLNAAKEHGWECFGVEVSEYAAGVAANSGVGGIFQGTLRDAGFAGDSFDVVTMIDVIEHLQHPAGELAEVLRILKPGGLYYLLTPDAESPAARLMGRNWFEIKPPEHLFYYSRGTIEQLLRRSGFEAVASATRGKVLTLEYITFILGGTSPALSRLLSLGACLPALYKRPIAFRSGFVAAQGLKPNRGLDG